MNKVRNKIKRKIANLVKMASLQGTEYVLLAKSTFSAGHQ